MIALLRKGRYKLIETKDYTKILYLDNDTYAWIDLPEIGEILVRSRRPHKTHRVLSLGHFCMYDVVDEPSLSDQIHLEFEVGREHWQGNLLLTGLPDAHHKRGRIVPTREVISDNPEYKNRHFINETLATT